METHFTFKNGNHRQWAMQQSLDKVYNILKRANDVYYNSSSTLFSDIIYDDILDIYNSRSSVKFSLIGAPAATSDKVKLPLHMGSMNKTYSIKEFIKWIEKNPENEYVVTPKIDGSSCMIVFGRNEKIHIYSRGDGKYGKDLAHLKNHILSSETVSLAKQFLLKNNLDSLVVRGELIVSKSNFADKVVGNFKTPRSLVNGLSNQKETTHSSNMSLLDFVLFEICSPQLKPSSQFEYASKMKFSCVIPDIVTLDSMLLNNNTIESSYLLKTLEKYRKSYDYDIDGLIITCNRKYKIPESGNPNYSIAFKSNGSGQITTVTDIEWNVSKHKMLIPTIVFDKVLLGKSEVTRCTGFNGWFIFSNSLGRGAKIRVVLSGEVIPYVSQIIEQANMPLMPNRNYIWNETKIHCILNGESAEFEIKRIINFVRTIGIDNLGPGLVKHLFDAGFNSISKILNITYDDLIGLERIESKMANKIYNSIHTVIDKPVDIAKVMDGSLCFGNGFGIKRCNQIQMKYPDFLDKFPEEDQLLELDGWSQKSIQKFKNGFAEFKNFISLLSLDLRYTQEKTLKNGGSYKLELRKICITGKRDKEIIDFCLMNNIEISASITNDTDILVCENTNSGSGKIANAENKGIPILTINEFKEKIKLK